MRDVFALREDCFLNQPNRSAQQLCGSTELRMEQKGYLLKLIEGQLKQQRELFLQRTIELHKDPGHRRDRTFRLSGFSGIPALGDFDGSTEVPKNEMHETDWNLLHSSRTLSLELRPESFQDGTCSLSILTSSPVAASADSVFDGTAAHQNYYRAEDGNVSKLISQAASDVNGVMGLVKKSRWCFELPAELDDDGFRWQKYSQRVLSGRKWRRFYFRCAAVGCAARRHIDANEDLLAHEDKHGEAVNSFRSTYIGQHNHTDDEVSASSDFSSTISTEENLQTLPLLKENQVITRSWDDLLMTGREHETDISMLISADRGCDSKTLNSGVTAGTVQNVPFKRLKKIHESCKTDWLSLKLD
eukprot:TRINITY_DN11038_c0_g1_i2.p1 TRINITY_DN11038_c0_g1~~TRINITY_DN11038_c0_g1_i2.p1  ORF type:complete len:359 (+),score=45.12 TRINITY_DN11038_c0_g1_i2:88-1164(+)